jgi:hypothetical protein
MQWVEVVLVNQTSGELDKISLRVKDDSDCTREVIPAITRAKWVLGTGDRIEIRGTGH